MLEYDQIRQKSRGAKPLTAKDSESGPKPGSKYQSPLRAACFTPASYFEQLLDLDDYTQLRVLGLILVETLGAYPKPRATAEITVERMAETFSVSREWILNSLSRLHDARLIVIGKSARGATCYSIAPEYVDEVKSAGIRKLKGRCPDCHTVGFFSTEFYPMPHAAFRKLGGCVDSATYRCALVVARYTLSWPKKEESKERFIEVSPAELDLADFVRLTGLEKRHILDAIATCEHLGLIGRHKRPGRPSLFWAIPENWGALQKRNPREITPPERGSKQEEKQEAVETTEITVKPAKTSADESRAWFFGRCLNCRHFVRIEPVPEEEFLNHNPPEKPKPPESPPRAAPKREKMSKQDEAWEILRKRYAK